jgi:polysaccharide lyase-like protein
VTYKPSGHRIAGDRPPLRARQSARGIESAAATSGRHPGGWLWAVLSAVGLCAAAYGIWQWTEPDSGEDVATPSVAQFFGSGLTASTDKDFGLDRVEILDEPDERLGPVLRVTYPRGSASQSMARELGSAEGGAQVLLAMQEPADELHLRYFVRFPDGFEFVKGGKLPGFYGGTANDGGKIPDGTDGFSTRFMWRTQGAGEVYAYLPTSEEHGTSLGRASWSFPTGRWVSIEQAVRLNQPDEEDGSVTVWLDGEEVFREDDLEYRTIDDLQIDGVFFSTFFGGADPSWASPEDQVVDFADFEVSTSYIGPEPTDD